MKYMSALQYKHNTNQSTTTSSLAIPMDYQSQSCKKLPIYHTLYFSLAILIYHKLVLCVCVCVCVCCHSISATDHASIDGDVQNIDQINLKDKASLYANYNYYTHNEALLF